MSGSGTSKWQVDPSDWRWDYRHGTLVIWPQGDVATRANQLRETYDPESQRSCPAHITVTQPFIALPTEDDWTMLEALVAGFTPYAIDVGPIEVFGTSAIVKFDIEPKPAVGSLRDALHDTGLFNLALPFTDGFIPHMTITEVGLSDTETANRLARTLNRENPMSCFQCSALSYIRPDHRFEFKEARSLPLGT
jgi:2'-5' RNA ligase